jgi:hypothetical protein
VTREIFSSVPTVPFFTGIIVNKNSTPSSIPQNFRNTSKKHGNCQAECGERVFYSVTLTEVLWNGRRGRVLLNTLCISS